MQARVAQGRGGADPGRVDGQEAAARGGIACQASQDASNGATTRTYAPARAVLRRPATPTWIRGSTTYSKLRRSTALAVLWCPTTPTWIRGSTTCSKLRRSTTLAILWCPTATHGFRTGIRGSTTCSKLRRSTATDERPTWRAAATATSHGTTTDGRPARYGPEAWPLARYESGWGRPTRGTQAKTREQSKRPAGDEDGCHGTADGATRRVPTVAGA